MHNQLSVKVFRSLRRITKQIDFERVRYEMPDQCRIHSPVHEQQLAPVLVHDWLSGRPVPNRQAIGMSWLPSNHRLVFRKIFGHG